MSAAELVSGVLLKITDAMTESHTFPVNLLGPVVWEVGDWTLDRVDRIEMAIPILVTTRNRQGQAVRNAFEIGRELGQREEPPAVEPLAPVRRLRSVE